MATQGDIKTCILKDGWKGNVKTGDQSAFVEYSDWSKDLDAIEKEIRKRKYDWEIKIKK
jgi:hypothetical protein